MNDKGDWRREDGAYYNPARVLEFAYSLSKAVILDNSCMPFETTVTIFKNDGFRQSIFERYYKIHAKEFDSGLFKVLKK